MPDDEEESLEQEALMRTTQDLFRRLVRLVPHMPEELETAAINADERPPAGLPGRGQHAHGARPGPGNPGDRPGQREAGQAQLAS